MYSNTRFNQLAIILFDTQILLTNLQQNSVFKSTRLLPLLTDLLNGVFNWWCLYDCHFPWIRLLFFLQPAVCADVWSVQMPSLPDSEVTLPLCREHQRAERARLATLTNGRTADGTSSRGKGQGAAATSGQELSSKYWILELGGPAEKVTGRVEKLCQKIETKRKMFVGYKATALIRDINGNVQGLYMER